MNLLAVALDPKFSWYISRAAGLMTWALCAASIVWGLLLSSKAVRRRGLPAWLLDLHTFLGTLALIFAGIHIGGLVADSYAHFSWKEILVPMGSEWRPGAVAWGVVSFYVLVAIQVTSWMRRRLPKRAWHAIHLGSFPLFMMGTLHGVMAGSDWTSGVVRWVGGGITLVVLAAIVLRLVARRRRAAQAEASPNRIRVRQVSVPPTELPDELSPAIVEHLPSLRPMFEIAATTVPPRSSVPQDGDAGVGPASDHVRQSDPSTVDLPFASFVAEMVADFDHLSHGGRTQGFTLGEEPAGGVDGESPGEFSGTLLEELGLLSRGAQAELGPRQ